MMLIFLFCIIFSTFRGGFSEDEIDLSETTTEFALNFLKASGKSNENAFFSPASISTCVGMVYAGASGKTKDQINDVFYRGLSDKSIYDQMKALATTLNSPAKAYNLSLANRLYNQENFKLLDSYLDSLKTYFLSEIKPVDFVKNAESVRKSVNDWVESKTQSKIKDLLPQGSLDANVRLVLVNAIYFKGSWASTFNETNTSKKPFHVSANSEIQVDMMRQTKKKFFYNENDDIQLLGLPYDNEELAMFVMLPKQRHGLSALEGRLNGNTILNLIRRSTKSELEEIQLPKFKLEKSIDLKEVLQSMKIVDLFSNDADLSGIDGKRDLFVSKAFHKAFIEVNEQGSEAAAATAVIVSRMSAIVTEQKSFVADHPFLFAIVDRRTWNPLFFGRFVRT